MKAILMARGAIPEPSYIRDFSRQWVLPNPAISDCSPCFFCCFAARLQTRSFLIGHNGAPQKTVKKIKALHVFHFDRDRQAIGWLHWPRWSADDKLYFIPSFSREAPCQKVIIVSKPRASPEELDPHTLFCRGYVSKVSSLSRSGRRDRTPEGRTETLT